MAVVKLHRTVGVRVGPVQVGGGAPVVVQSMTMTDTADAAAPRASASSWPRPGSEMVRVTVNLPEAAAAVPEIKQRMLDAGVTAPLIGDFHYNGHLLLTRFPDCARALDKYRINPGNVGTGRRRDEQFATICSVARDNGKPVRIGVNGGSLNQELVLAKMQENTDRDLGQVVRRHHQRVHGAVGGAVDGARAGVRPAQGSDHHLVQDVAAARSDRRLSRSGAQDRSAAASRPDRGRMGIKGLVWSASAMGVLLNEGIGDTIRVSLTPRPGGDRREEVYAACELLQSLGFARSRRASRPARAAAARRARTFQELAERTQDYIRERMPKWKTQYDGVEAMTLAVMGCVVNGPGESKAASIGISLPGTGEAPNCPVYIDGQHFTTLRGTYEELATAFRELVDNYVETRYHEARRRPAFARSAAPC